MVRSIWPGTHTQSRTLTLNQNAAGHVAKLVGMLPYSRHVGQGRHSHLPCPPAPVNGADAAVSYVILCYAIISQRSSSSRRRPTRALAGRSVVRGKDLVLGLGTDGTERQHEALEAEDVEVRVSRMNELLVDLAAYGWFPLPGTTGLGPS